MSKTEIGEFVHIQQMQNAKAAYTLGITKEYYEIGMLFAEYDIVFKKKKD